MPVDVASLPEGRQRYGLFTDDQGGILDDLMFANRGDHLLLVVNAGCKEADIAHMQAHLSEVAEVIPVTDRALLALQGPKAEAVLEALVPGVAAMKFMDIAVLPSQWGLDAMASFQLAQNTSLQVNVNNLFDERLYDASHVGLFANRAPGRSITAKLDYRF